MHIPASPMKSPTVPSWSCVRLDIVVFDCLKNDVCVRVCPGVRIHSCTAMIIFCYSFSIDLRVHVGFVFMYLFICSCSTLCVLQCCMCSRLVCVCVMCHVLCLMCYVICMSTCLHLLAPSETDREEQKQTGQIFRVVWPPFLWLLPYL